MVLLSPRRINAHSRAHDFFSRKAGVEAEDERKELSLVDLLVFSTRIVNDNSNNNKAKTDQIKPLPRTASTEKDGLRIQITAGRLRVTTF